MPVEGLLADTARTYVCMQPGALPATQLLLRQPAALLHLLLTAIATGKWPAWCMRQIQEVNQLCTDTAHVAVCQSVLRCNNSASGSVPVHRHTQCATQTTACVCMPSPIVAGMVNQGRGHMTKQYHSKAHSCWRRWRLSEAEVAGHISGSNPSQQLWIMQAMASKEHCCCHTGSKTQRWRWD